MAALDGKGKSSEGGSLLVFSTASMEEMLSKGNLWYVRHYEVYFEKVMVAFMFGGPHEEVSQGKTSLISLGTGKAFWSQLMTVPYRVYKLTKAFKPTYCLTADLLFYWWVFSFARFFLRTKVWLMPVYLLEEVYKNGCRSITGLPRWAERRFCNLSFAAADAVLSAKAFGSFPDFLASHPVACNKLTVTQTVADALPSLGFFDTLSDWLARGKKVSRPEGGFRLISVGRLHEQKMLKDLIRMMALLKEARGIEEGITLTLVGDGQERIPLEKLMRELGVQDMVIFTGAVPNEELPKHLFQADVYVSPMTGTALREAALCGLPVVAYNIDWVRGFLVHEENALLVPRGNYQEMAAQVLRLAENNELRVRLSNNIRELALSLWSPSALKSSLEEVFG